MKIYFKDLYRKLQEYSFRNPFHSRNQSNQPIDRNFAPISLVLHWLGIGDIIVCFSILHGLKRQSPDREVRFYLATSQESETMRFLAWAKLGWENSFITDGRDVPGEVFEIGKPGDDNADPERLGVPGFRQDLWAKLCRTTAERFDFNCHGKELQEARECLKTMGVALEKPVIYISPVTANKWRNWPISQWRELEQMLHSHFIQVIVGALKPEPWASEEELSQFSTRFFLGPCEPVVLIGVLSLMDCIVSNDSGFAHLGGALGMPTVAICGGNYDGPAVYGWYGNVKVVQAESRDIMDNTVEEVLKAIHSSVMDSNSENRLKNICSNSLFEH